MKIGFLGGSFDPVHLGHLCAAQDAFEQMKLDRVVFIPASQAPLKPDSVKAPANMRLAMLRAAIEDRAAFDICDWEIRRGGVNYTVDTLRYLRAEYANDRLFWIIGTDQLARLDKWKNAAELVQLVEFICLDRPGYDVQEPPPLPGLRLFRCPGHRLEISSTELRERARLGLPLDFFMPNKAIVTLKENDLYS